MPAAIKKHIFKNVEIKVHKNYFYKTVSEWVPLKVERRMHTHAAWGRGSVMEHD